MSELLTSLDIVNQAFKKTMRGYDPSEVDEFLDRVAECIQVYVQKIKDYERVIEEQSEKLRDYENIKGSLHEALLMAQRTAEEKVTNANMLADEKVAQADRVSDERIGHATVTAENILADARIKAERMIRDAETSVLDFGHELTLLQELRNSGFANLHAFISEVNGVLDKAESTGKIQIPTMTLNIMSRSGAQGYGNPPASSTQAYDHARGSAPGAPPAANAPSAPSVSADAYAAPAPAPQPAQPLPPEQMQAQLANTLSVLGIDLSLLNTNPTAGFERDRN
ncbi:MAG: DivIVA domain-containing protein [Synergistaceae bacterium]|jgi:cell division initiation protein|nr:DivIVA domain-containing protein [Synergistaceae bacterium]